MRDDNRYDAVLIGEVVTQLMQVIQPLVLLLGMATVVVKVERRGTELNLLEELIPEWKKGAT